MSTKQQKIKFGKDDEYTKRTRIPISSEYDDGTKVAIAQDIIDVVVKRTLKRKDKDGETMKRYSKEYASTPEAKAAGKTAGQAANLNLSGDMLFALGEYKKIGKTFIELGYKGNSDENAKADGNVRGTYGKNRASKKKARDFMGIKESELKKILSNYPLDNEEKRKESVDIVGLAASIAARKKDGN